jgi:hypothetical protein
MGIHLMTDQQQIGREENLEEFRRRSGAAPKVSGALMRKPATVGIVNAAVEAIGEAVAAEIKQLRERVADLERKSVEIAKRGLFYRGVHQRADSYKPGDAVTFDGSLFIAIADVAPGELPGKSDGKWQLAAKRGRDGRER